MTRPTSPFKFLDAYSQEDADIFFGREKETEALYDALSGVKHLLVYGPSGAGKTSLIECGLRNQFSDADWHALTIRRGDDMTAAVFAGINDALHRKMELNPETGLPGDGNTDFGQAIENLFAERYQPVYLLFDQFEELLISGREDEKRDFFTRLNRLIRHKVPCRVMLVMREEFIGHLSEFEPLCPSIFQHRFRLEKMRRTPVQAVIFHMLEAPRYAAHFRVDDPARLAETILSKLPDQRQEIELAHVQVFLGELWERASATGKNGDLPLLHRGLVRENDNLEGVLDSFLKKQLAELEPAHGEKAPLELLACMISERHTKLQLGEAALLHELDEKGVALQKPLSDLLEDFKFSKIIRELISGGVKEYEISHDVLALVVGRNLTEEMKMREDAAKIYRLYEKGQGILSQEALDELRFYQKYKAYPVGLERRIKNSEAHIVARRVEELEKTRSRLRTVRVMLALVGVAMLYAAGAAYYAAKQRDIAEDAVFRSAVMAAQGKTDVSLYDTTNVTRIYYDKITFLTFKNFGLSEIPVRVSYLKNLKALDLGGNKLSSLPPQIWELKSLTWLNLSDNLLDSLPPQIGDLKSLTKLYLWNNKLSSLPPQIGELKSLTTLNLSGNKLNSLPPQIGELKSLTGLNLGSDIFSIRKNQLKELPTEIGELKSLMELDLNENRLSSLPTQIGDLKSLTELDLSGNKLSRLPPQIGELKSLTVLDLRENDSLNLASLCTAFADFPKPIILTTYGRYDDASNDDANRLLIKISGQSSLPPQIGELKSLTTLGLGGSRLNGLPPQIGELKSLTELDLGGNSLSSLPPQIGEWKSLTKLDLSNNNKLSSLPPQIGELKSLTELDMGGNSLSSLPPQIGELKSLTKLDLYANSLSSLPPQIWELKSLTRLNLKENQLSSLSPQIGELKSLTTLYLSWNQLSSLPPQIGELKNLTELYLRSNQFSSLPPQIVELKSLTKLFLSGNQLSSLPPQIGELKSLTELDLSENQLDSLPAEIGELKSLMKLDLDGNSLSSLPLQIGELKSLTTLDLIGNQLSSLPPQIGELISLKELDLTGNDNLNIASLCIAFADYPKPITLTTFEDAYNDDANRLLIIISKQSILPPQIGELKSLTELDLSDNPISELEKEKIRQLLPWCKIKF